MRYIRNWKSVLHALLCGAELAIAAFIALAVVEYLTNRHDGIPEQVSRDFSSVQRSILLFLMDGGEIPKGGLPAVIAAMKERSRDSLINHDPFRLQEFRFVQNGIDPWGTAFIFVYSRQDGTARSPWRKGGRPRETSFR
jgi:hypothetical protein